MTPAEAGEIVRNPQLRATWEQLTGKKLPTESVNKARQMILNTHADALQSQPQSTANGIDNVIELLTGEKATTEPQNSVNTSGDITTPPNASNDATASPVELNSAPNGEAGAQNVEEQKNTAPNGTESTSINTDPATHTPEQQRVINEYVSSADKGIVAFIERVRQLKNPKYRNSVRYSISEVSPKAAQEVTSLTGVDVSGFENIITGSAVDHIEARHGSSGRADHSMSNINDLARVQYVLDNFDGAYLLTNDDGSPSVSDVWKNSDGTPAQRVVFYKKLDGTYYAVEATPDSKARVLAVESAFIGSEKNIGSTGTVLNMEKNSPQVTPEAPQRANASIDSIPTAPHNVNSEQSGNSGTEQKVKSNLGTQSPDARTSQTVETLLDSDIISDERAEQLNPYVEKGRFDYIPDANEAQVDRATKKIAKNGWEQSVKDFHDEVVKGKSGKDLMAEGAVLLKDAANSDASAKAYLELANDYIELAHRASEALQAAKIVQQLTPEGRLYLLSKNVDSINKNLTEGQRKKIAKKKGGNNLVSIVAKLRSGSVAPQFCYIQ